MFGNVANYFLSFWLFFFFLTKSGLSLKMSWIHLNNNYVDWTHANFSFTFQTDTIYINRDINLPQTSLKSCLVSFFFKFCSASDTLGSSSFVYAQQLGQGYEVCTWGKVLNCLCQLYCRTHTFIYILRFFAKVAFHQLKKKKKNPHDSFEWKEVLIHV